MRFVLIGLLCLLVLALALHNLFSYDVWTHLACGRYIIQHARVPFTDPFSYTLPATQPWVDHEWLFQIILYPVYLLGGVNGLIMLRVVLVLAAFTVLWLAVYDRRNHWFTVLIFAAAAMASYTRFTTRPELVSYVFFGLSLLALERYRRTRHPIWLYLLPVMMIPWVNVHGMFIMGPLVVLIFLLGELLQAKLPGPWPWVAVGALVVGAQYKVTDMLWPEMLFCSWPLAAAVVAAAVMHYRGRGPRWWELTTVRKESLGRWALVLGLMLAATLLNPYLWRGAIYPLQVAAGLQSRSASGMAMVGELTPTLTFINLAQVWWFKLLAVVTAVSFALNFRRTRFWRVLLVGISFQFGLAALRSLPVFTLSAALCASLNFGEWWETNAERVRAWLRPVWTRVVARIALQTALAAMLVWLMLDVASDRMHVWDRTGMRFGLGLAHAKFSPEAMRFILDNRLKGPMFNNFGIGGLCMFYLYPEHRVFIDGRAELYSEAQHRGANLLQVYSSIVQNPQAFRSLSRQPGMDFNFAILSLGSKDVMDLAQSLYDDPGWKLVFMDAGSMVFVRNTPQNYATIDRYASNYDFARRELLVAAHPHAIPVRPEDYAGLYDRFRRLLPFLPRRHYLPEEVLGDAEFWGRLDDLNLAEARLMGLKELDPEVPDLYFSLAINEQLLAFRLAQELRGASPARRAVIQQMIRERFSRADAYYAEVERLQPDFPGLYYSMATYHGNRGQKEEAREYLKKHLSQEYNTASILGASGDFAERLGDDVWAAELYRKSVRRDPYRPGIRARLALALLKINEPTQALAQAEEAIRQDPNNADARTAATQARRQLETLRRRSR